jgi:hypothetical protein
MGLEYVMVAMFVTEETRTRRGERSALPAPPTYNLPRTFFILLPRPFNSCIPEG